MRLICSAGIGIIIGTILQAASVTYGMMIFARIFNGVFNGMLTSTVPTYQSECSRPERRGPDVMISATVNILWVNDMLEMIADGIADSCARTGLDLPFTTPKVRYLGDSPLLFNVFSHSPCEYLHILENLSSPTQAVCYVVLSSSRIPAMARFKRSTRRIYRCAGCFTERSGRRSRGSSHLDRYC